MADIFWIVSQSPGDDGETEDGIGWSLQLVEFRDSWRTMKERREQLVQQGCTTIEVFDDDGVFIWAADGGSYCGLLDHMSAPRVAGLYRWSESTGHVRVELPPMSTWRRTAPAINEQLKGTPRRT